VNEKKIRISESGFTEDQLDRLKRHLEHDEIYRVDRFDVKARARINSLLKDP
jgi:hypothetical protein